MNFEALKRRVAKHEMLVQGRMSQTQTQWRLLKTTWRDSWTPLRIVVAGVVSGFIVGRADPVRALGKIGAFSGGGAKVLQMISAVSGVFASLQAATAADKADNAAEKADDAADKADDVAGGSPRGSTSGSIPSGTRSGAAPNVRPPPMREEPVVAPRPAEAATELSER